MSRLAGDVRRLVQWLVPQPISPSSQERERRTMDALADVVVHHGLRLPTRPMKISTSADPIDLLRSRALDVGLQSRLLRVEMPTVQRMALPCMLQHRHHGWVTLVAANEGHLTVRVPGQAPMTLPTEVLALEFSGLALEFKRTS